jgi:hypothetical protein
VKTTQRHVGDEASLTYSLLSVNDEGHLEQKVSFISIPLKLLLGTCSNSPSSRNKQTCTIEAGATSRANGSGVILAYFVLLPLGEYWTVIIFRNECLADVSINI